MSRTSTIILSSFENKSSDAFRITKQFPLPYQSHNDEIGLQSITLYNSWFNITTTFGNTEVSYIWTDGTTYPVVFAEGSYSIDQISEYIQTKMKQNKHYLIDENGNDVYYLSLVINSVYYSVVITLTSLPVTLPQGWSMPAGATWTLGNGQTPRFVTLNNNFGKLIGFAPNLTFPSEVQTTTQQFQSSNTPMISPVTSVNLACNWVNDSRFNTYPSIVGSFIPDVGIGELIYYAPPILCLYPVTQNKYSEIEILFLDQEFRPLMLKDRNQIQIMMLLKSDQ